MDLIQRYLNQEITQKYEIDLVIWHLRMVMIYQLGPIASPLALIYFNKANCNCSEQVCPGLVCVASKN